ncbi:uncharacterized protein VNE69_05254 [Vairimorpha necatrix]|uniref:Uncharacterized protein n=1 Tax=Vairimorpha necatrix TaxID=6039 RepID=A0AAX4JCH0_9MICR
MFLNKKNNCYYLLMSLYISATIYTDQISGEEIMPFKYLDVNSPTINNMYNQYCSHHIYKKRINISLFSSVLQALYYICHMKECLIQKLFDDRILSLDEEIPNEDVIKNSNSFQKNLKCCKRNENFVKTLFANHNYNNRYLEHGSFLTRFSEFNGRLTINKLQGFRLRMFVETTKFNEIGKLLHDVEHASEFLVKDVRDKLLNRRWIKNDKTYSFVDIVFMEWFFFVKESL